MYKIFAAIAVAALLAGVAVVAPGLSLTKVEASTPKAGAKGDRLDYRPTGIACSQRGWPYFETDCLRSTTTPSRQVKAVRLVTTDRVSFDRPTVDRSLAMR